MLIFSSRYFVWRAFSLACRAVSWEREEERRSRGRGNQMGKERKRRREEGEEIEEK